MIRRYSDFSYTPAPITTSSPSGGAILSPVLRMRKRRLSPNQRAVQWKWWSRTGTQVCDSEASAVSPVPCLLVTGSFQDTRPLHLLVIETMPAVHSAPLPVCCHNNPDAEDGDLSFYLALLGCHTSKLGAPESRDRILTGSKPFYLFFSFLFQLFCWKSGYHILRPLPSTQTLLTQNLHFFHFFVFCCQFASPQQWPQHPATSKFLRAGSDVGELPENLK